jgi:hypothetical protein
MTAMILKSKILICLFVLSLFISDLSAQQANTTNRDTLFKVIGNTTIRWSPSPSAYVLYVEVQLSNQIVGSANLTPVAPSFVLKFTSGNDSISGNLNSQFSTGPEGQLNLLMGNFTWKSLTQGSTYNAMIGTWTTPATLRKD